MPIIAALLPGEALIAWLNSLLPVRLFNRQVQIAKRDQQCGVGTIRNVCAFQQRSAAV